MKAISRFTFGGITVRYLLNSRDRAVLLLLPSGCRELNEIDARLVSACEVASLAHLHLAEHSAGIFSNSLKLSETLDRLSFKRQTVREDGERIEVETVEEAPEHYGICHTLTWYRGERGLECRTTFYNDSTEERRLELLTSASLDLLSPYLDENDAERLVFHRFKAGWSMEGLLQSDTLTALGLERAWGMSAESLKLGAVGSRAVREYHPYCAVEDTENGVTWGMSLAHNASWQLELSRIGANVSLTCGLADGMTGQWSKRIRSGERFTAPTAYLSVVRGGIAEVSNALLSMRHRAIDALGETDSMAITYNDFVTTWGKPTHENMLRIARRLAKGKTKYWVMDAGWYTPVRAIGDWNVDPKAFPKGMKAYCDEVRALGMIPGIWMEFECADSHAAIYDRADGWKLTKDGHDIVGHVINGRMEKFFDFRDPAVTDYLDEKVIRFLRENGFGYLKVDYNASIGAGIDGEDSPGENLRAHMGLVRDYFEKLRREVPGLVIENCASGGCRLEPSMMDITEMSSASDTHEVLECAVVAANLHYLTPPRQNQIWATLHPEYSSERFSYVISQTFLGRLCWSGDILGLSEERMEELFRAERFYEQVAHIIKRGDSYIHRTDRCSFHDPRGTQVVVRYSEDGREALVVLHRFRDARPTELSLSADFLIRDRLYPDGSSCEGGVLRIEGAPDLSGNVLHLVRRSD